MKENILATQAFANPENISEPQMGIEPATFWVRFPSGAQKYFLGLWKLE